jgi:polyhydroxybutyrate depolymerase
VRPLKERFMPSGLLILLTLLAAQPQLSPVRAGDYTRQLTVGGLKRTYHIHVPPGYDPRKPAPVVVVLHGALMNGPIMEWFCGVSKKADEAGFIAVYPDGTGPGGSLCTWNAGVFPGKLNPRRADDVAFIGSLLDQLPYLVHVDRKRVYVAGMSNGAMMAYRLAIEMPQRIAAVCAISGVLALEKAEPPSPMPILHIHGTKDGLVPFEGTKNGAGPYQFCSVDETLQHWIKVNGCSERPKVTELPTVKDELQVVRKDYGNGKEMAPVVLYVINGGGHTWPGMQRHASFLGAATMNLSANDVMWDFFRRFRLK